MPPSTAKAERISRSSCRSWNRGRKPMRPRSMREILLACPAFCSLRSSERAVRFSSLRMTMMLTSAATAGGMTSAYASSQPGRYTGSGGRE